MIIAQMPGGNDWMKDAQWKYFLLPEINKMSTSAKMIDFNQ
jgi:hypothetical protein